MISLKYHSQKFFYINESLIMVKHANITNGTLKGLAITFELLMFTIHFTDLFLLFIQIAVDIVIYR